MGVVFNFVLKHAVEALKEYLVPSKLTVVPPLLLLRHFSYIADKIIGPTPNISLSQT